MRDDDDLFDADVAAANRAEMERGSEESPVTFPSGEDAEREHKAQHALSGPPIFLSSDEIDLWLEKHGAVAVLGALAILDRRERDGKVIDHKVAYLEGILADRKIAKRGRHTSAEPEFHQSLERHRERLRRDAEDAGYDRPGDYADSVLREQQLARQIAAMDDGPERERLVIEWRGMS